MRKARLRSSEKRRTDQRGLVALVCGACLIGLILPHVALSQEGQEESQSPVDIIERSASVTSAEPTRIATPQSSNNLSTLFYELQLLQNEVMKLRGELEELGHRLDELSRQQSAQYMDIDRRLQGLPASTGTSPEDLTTGQPAEGTDPTAVPEGTAITEPLNEEDAYRQSFALIEGRRFEQAVTAFDQFLIAYPNGNYTPNAFYWLGELHLRLEDLEKSRQSFMQVLTLFPDSAKAPDALYKLGIVYDRLGDRETAEQHLRRILTEHPNSTAASLSREYLRQRS